MSNNMTWHCELVIKNDEDCNDEIKCITTHVMNHVYHDHKGEAYADQKRVRIYVLAQFIRAYVEERTDADAERNYHDPMTQELILGALQEVNYREIAEDLIGDYSPKSPAEVAEDEEFFQIMGFGNFDINED